ncbi:hypothetical protein V6N11_055535 [Hibiscus sabdariffa]|uniref:Reverse transcriptase zinc-binding domain-containing protein n=1 Tax=Hibiscus sabdariffa TaxID=183260 RepID=A0ABR2NQT7_9ROSI
MGRALVSIWPSSYTFLSWAIGDDRMVQLWFDNWAYDIGSLIHRKKDNVLVDEDLLVCNMVTPNDSWNWNLLHQFLHLIALSHIMSIPAPGYVASLDHCSWDRETW